MTYYEPGTKLGANNYNPTKKQIYIRQERKLTGVDPHVSVPRGSVV